VSRHQGPGVQNSCDTLAKVSIILRLRELICSSHNTSSVIGITTMTVIKLITTNKLNLVHTKKYISVNPIQTKYVV
jgi:hypothetical protein